MKKEEDRLAELFQSYNPPMTPQADFIRRLDDRLIAVEVVKDVVKASRRNSRIVAFVALVIGIVAGSLTTLLVYNVDPVRLSYLLSGTVLEALFKYPVTVASVAGGAVAVGVSMSLYHFARSLRTMLRKA